MSYGLCWERVTFMDLKTSCDKWAFILTGCYVAPYFHVGHGIDSSPKIPLAPSYNFAVRVLRNRMMIGISENEPVLINMHISFDCIHYAANKYHSCQ